MRPLIPVLILLASCGGEPPTSVGPTNPVRVDRYCVATFRWDFQDEGVAYRQRALQVTANSFQLTLWPDSGRALGTGGLRALFEESLGPDTAYTEWLALWPFRLAPTNRRADTLSIYTDEVWLGQPSLVHLFPEGADSARSSVDTLFPNGLRIDVEVRWARC